MLVKKTHKVIDTDQLTFSFKRTFSRSALILKNRSIVTDYTQKLKFMLMFYFCGAFSIVRYLGGVSEVLEPFFVTQKLLCKNFQKYKILKSDFREHKIYLTYL